MAYCTSDVMLLSESKKIVTGLQILVVWIFLPLDPSSLVSSSFSKLNKLTTSLAFI